MYYTNGSEVTTVAYPVPFGINIDFRMQYIDSIPYGDFFT